MHEPYERIVFYEPSYQNFPDQVNRIWCLLNSDQALQSMFAMTENRLPAVDELHEIEDFREIIESEPVLSNHNFRKMTGQFCRQVMSRMGYEPIRRRRTKRSPIFRSGIVYQESNLE